MVSHFVGTFAGRIAAVNELVEGAQDDILKFFREIVAIPSVNSDIKNVSQRVGTEMRKLGFDEVYVDRYGSIVGRIGESAENKGE